MANIQKGAHVAIFGAGPIGIINMLTSIGYGAEKIIITDVNNDKLKMFSDWISVIDVHHSSVTCTQSGKLCGE